MRLTKKVLALLFISIFLPVSHSWAWKPSVVDSLTPDAIQSNLKPFGDVEVDGEVRREKTVAIGPDAGKKRYEAYCKACHATGVSGAPKFKNEEDWAKRLNEIGLDGLVKTAISGIRAMPPKGGCNSCADEEIRMAIKHMLP